MANFDPELHLCPFAPLFLVQATAASVSAHVSPFDVLGQSAVDFGNIHLACFGIAGASGTNLTG